MSTTISYRATDAATDQRALTADTTLSASDSGKTILLDAVGEDILLPAPIAGVNYKFIVTAAVATTSWTVAATGALISGSVTEAGLVQLAAGETTITIVKNGRNFYCCWQTFGVIPKCSLKHLPKYVCDEKPQDWATRPI